MKYLLAVLASLLVLTGCAKEVIVQPLPITIPEYMLIDNTPVPPPAIGRYLMLSTSEKEELLFSIIREQYLVIDEQHRRFKTIRDYQSELIKGLEDAR